MLMINWLSGLNSSSSENSELNIALESSWADRCVKYDFKTIVSETIIILWEMAVTVTPPPY
jgi:hypothetical protein